MKRHTVVTLPGDGIGPVVLAEAIRVLEAVRFPADYVDAEIGWRCWCTQGNALPARTVELLREHRLGLFGAITSKPKREAVDELDPALRGQGFSYYSPILELPLGLVYAALPVVAMLMLITILVDLGKELRGNHATGEEP